MLMSAAAIIAFVAVNPSGQLLMGKSDARHNHTMSPLLAIGPQVTLDGVGGQYALFRCQRGVDPFGRTCYDPFQMRHAYGIDSLIAAGYDGTGHTIVIVDAFDDPFLPGDLASFDTFYGLPAPNFTQVYPDGPTSFDSDWAAEMTLDVEWSHAIAPGANIVLVHAKSNNDADILSAIRYAVDNDLGDVISMSFGEDERCVGSPGSDLISAYHDVFVAATQKHITLFASSGDQGAALPTCDGNSWSKAVSSPASDPLVTGVGGTELQAVGYPSSCTDSSTCNPPIVPGTYQGEIVWNEGPLGDFSNLLGNTEATGGGFSVIYGEPPYQNGTDGLHGGHQRAVPDVAYNAAIFHGVLVQFLVGNGGGTFLFGGTSCGAPQWAALTAIANQKAGARLGFLNKAIYDIGKHGNQTAFHDITTGNNSALEFDSTNNPVLITGFSAGTGWDATTGFGSPIGTTVVDALIHGVSPGDARSAIATTNAHRNPTVPGHMKPH